MAAPPDVRLGLVGTGADLVRAIEALRGVPAVEITVVADASDRSPGAQLAHSLKLPVVKNAMEVFRTKANVVLEVNGDERQYERLLAIKPPGVEVMSIRGARLLIGLLKQAAAAEAAPPPPRPEAAGASPLPPLAAALQSALRPGSTPVAAVRVLLPPLAAAGKMELAAVARAANGGFEWIAPEGGPGPLGRLSAAQLADAARKGEPVWLTRPTRDLGIAGLFPLRVGTEVLGLLAVGRAQEVAAGPGEALVLRFGADLLAAALGATRPPAPPSEVVKEVVREVPVEVIREVEKEVVREVPVEVVREVVREVPVEVVREVEKEVIKEVPVEVVREVVKEVPVEVVREVVKEVPVEVLKEVPVEVVREVVREVPVEVVRDLSEVDQEEMRRLRRRVEELETAREQLAALSGRVPLDEKMQALLNMASGVGHVFSNVLAGILGRTQLLLQRAEREKTRELAAGLAEIEAATRAGIETLTRIQEFARARPPEAFSRVDLNDLVQRAVERARPRWRDGPAGKGVRIELATRFGAHQPVLGVETDLLEALVQLIANAVDAMPRGGVLTIRTSTEGGRGLVAVSDTGVGMSEAVRRRAFEPFFSTKGETGLGLGLSVVHGIVTRHGGEVSIASEEGRGTTVVLRLPSADQEASLAAPPAREAEQGRVLVVDDDETVRAALGDLLQGAGYAVTLAASGLEGIAKVRERERGFDLVVTDLGMPDVPGWEVVEAVKQVAPGTPVVIMSGFDRARATRRARELGVDVVISKPFVLQEFLNAVRGLLLGRKRA